MDGRFGLKLEKNGIAGPLYGNMECWKLVEYSDMNKVTKKLKDSIEKLNQELDSKK